VGTEQHEAAAAQVAGGWMNDGKGEAGGDGCVDRIAAGAQHFNAGIGGQMMHADHHAVLSEDWLLVEIGQRGFCALLPEGAMCGKRESGNGEESLRWE
jgi:hypothetical protein